MTALRGTKPCPSCGERSCFVTDSRPFNGPDGFWRRAYKCGACGERFTTLERVIAQRGQAIPNTTAASVAGFIAAVEHAAAEWFGADAKSRAGTQTGRARSNG